MTEEKGINFFNMGLTCFTISTVVCLIGGFIAVAPQTVFDVSPDMHASEHIQASWAGAGIAGVGTAGMVGGSYMMDHEPSAAKPAMLRSEPQASTLG